MVDHLPRALPGVSSAANGLRKIAAQARDALASAVDAGAALPPSIEEGGITPYELRDYREPWSCWCPRTIQLLAPSVPLYPVAADVAGRHSHPGRLRPVGCRRSPASPTTPRRGSRHGRPPDRSHYQSSQRHVHAEGKQHRRRHPAASERNDVVAVSAICRRRRIR